MAVTVCYKDLQLPLVVIVWMNHTKFLSPLQDAQCSGIAIYPPPTYLLPLLHQPPNKTSKCMFSVMHFILNVSKYRGSPNLSNLKVLFV